MTYGGVLTDSSGTPLTGMKTIQLAFWPAATGGTPACTTLASAVSLVAGNFQVALPDSCTAAVHALGDLWVEVLVDGATLGRTKLGAVPYAVEADSASRAVGALDARIGSLMPPRSIVSANLSAADVTSNFDASGLGRSPGPYAGWAICNGNNGTPNLAGRFVRISASGAGATGGSDTIAAHTHAIDHDHAAFNAGTEGAHTHSTPAHQHTLSSGFDNNNEFAAADAAGLPLFGSAVITANHFSRATGGIGNFASGPVRLGLTDTSGGGTSGPGSPHSHVVDPPAFTGASGAAPAADNRPAFAELVALMRL